MDSLPQAQELLTALGSHIGIGVLQFNEENVCRLVLDKRLIIDLEFISDSGAIQVHSVVGNDPGEGVPVLRKLLAANLFGQGTAGGVLALDEDTEEIILSRSFDAAGTKPDRFVSAVEEFAGYADTWIAELMDDGEPAASTATRVWEPVVAGIRV